MIDNNKEYILCAAIWYKEINLINPNAIGNWGSKPYNTDEGIVICGWRHSNCILTLSALTGERDFERGKHVQGFLTSKNRFVDREEGLKVAKEAGQVSEDLESQLFSEDLYRL